MEMCRLPPQSYLRIEKEVRIRGYLPIKALYPGTQEKLPWIMQSGRTMAVIPECTQASSPPQSKALPKVSI